MLMRHLSNHFTVVMLIILNLLYLVPINSIEVTEKLPWNEGMHHSYVWLILIVVLGLSVVLNGFSLYLICFIKKVRTTNMASLIFALNSVDLLMSIDCLIQCIINLKFKQLYGHNIGCEFQAVTVGFFSFWEACVLALISYVVERKVCAGISFNEWETFRMVLGTGFFSACLALSVNYLPFSGYHLYASGIYCFIDMTTPVGGAGFAFGIIVPTAIMADRYYRIWKNVSDAQAILRGRGIETQAKARYTHTAKKMALFIVTFFGCAVPYLISAMYEIITWQYSPALLDIFSGTGLHFSSVINPLLFYALNDDAKDAVWEVLGRHLVCFFVIGTSLVHPLREAKVGKRTHILSYSIGSEDEWKMWLEDQELSLVFRQWCESNFVAENFLFYHDVERHNLIGQNVASKLLEILLNNDTTDNSKVEEVKNLWMLDLYNATLVMYEMYIQIPSAPLEVNISGATRHRVQKVLGVTEGSVNTNKGVCNCNIPPFPEVWKLPVEEAKVIIHDIVHVFDESFVTIGKVIASDVFPRFKNSQAYLKAVSGYNV